MPALPRFLVLLAIFLSANSGDAFMNLSSAVGNLVPVNHWIWFVEPMSKPTNEPSLKPTVKPTKWTELPNILTSKRGKYSLLEKQDAELTSKITVSIAQFTSNTSYAFEAVHGVSHVHVKYIVTGRVTIRDGRDKEIQSMCPDLSLSQPSNWQGPKQRSLVIAASVPFASFCSMSSGLAYCWVHSHTGFESVTSTQKVSCSVLALLTHEPVTFRTKVSCNTFASLVCEPITSTNQINQDKSSATFKLVVASVSNNNALSFNDKSSSTFKLVVASVTNEFSKGPTIDSPAKQCPVPNDNPAIESSFSFMSQWL